MLGKIFKFLSFIFTYCATCTVCFGDECQYQQIKTALIESCSGISEELEQIKKMGTINVVVSAVGTGAAGGALFAGLKKRDIDKKTKEIEQQMQDVKDMSDKDFLNFLKNMAALSELKEQYNSMCTVKRELQAKSKKLGNIRTGLMVGNTATAVAGTIISAKNKNESKDIKTIIQDCLDTIKQYDQQIGQARFDCAPEQYDKLKNAVNACKQISTQNMDKITTHTGTSQTVSAVNIGTGLAGTVTSALANSSNKLDDRTQKLNTAANVLAGASAVASGTSTVFNAITLKRINENIDFAKNCAGALDNL